MKTIYIYKDSGVGKEAFKHTMHTVSELGMRVKIIDAAQIKEGKWCNDCDLLIMPGGADVHYARKLKGEANKKIREFVETGGSYLGICAGSYYGASSIEFDKGGPLEVIGDRELGFFSGKAIGPTLAKYDYKSNSGARAADIKLDSGEHIRLYSIGGAYFENAQNFSGVSIIGSYYPENLPTILHIQHGRGTVILSGVHFEYNPSLLDASDPYQAPLIPILSEDESERQKLSNRIFGLTLHLNRG